jgi:hypothetical protein
MSTLTLTPPVAAARSHLSKLKEVPVANSNSRTARVTRLGQVLLGLLWLMDGLLQFQPYMFGKTFITGVLLPNAVGQPGIIASSITWIANLIEPHVVIFNLFAATVQVLIGVGLLYRRTVKPALLVSFGWAVGIWFTGEGLGMIFTGNANPLTGAPGAALLYILAGLICWPRTERSPERAERAERAGRAGRARIKAYGLLGERGTRRVWAALWLGSAMLWLLPSNSSANATHDAIAAVPAGAGWLTSILNTAANATAGHGTVIAVAMAGISAAVGIAALRNRLTNAALAIGVAISLIYWVIGQGFGGVLTGQATDVSTAPLMILIAALLYGHSRERKIASTARDRATATPHHRVTPAAPESGSRGSSSSATSTVVPTANHARRAMSCVTRHWPWTRGPLAENATAARSAVSLGDGSPPRGPGRSF